MRRFLNRKDVQADLGVTKMWESCSQLPHLMVHTSYYHSKDSKLWCAHALGIALIGMKNYTKLCILFDLVFHVKFHTKVNNASLAYNTVEPEILVLIFNKLSSG